MLLTPHGRHGKPRQHGAYSPTVVKGKEQYGSLIAPPCGETSTSWTKKGTPPNVGRDAGTASPTGLVNGLRSFRKSCLVH